jgi:hypothetical protein
MAATTNAAPVVPRVSAPVSQPPGDQIEQAGVLVEQHQQAGRQHAGAHHHGRRPGDVALGGRRIARRVQHQQGLGRRHAIRERQLLIDDEMLAHRRREQHAEQGGDSQPDEGLQLGRIGGEVDDLGRAQHLEGGEDRTHKGGLGRRRAGGLHDVVLPAVIALAGDDAEDDVAEEGRNDGDVGPEPQLQHHVGIHRAHDRRDDGAGDQGLDRQLAVLRSSGGVKSDVGDVRQLQPVRLRLVNRRHRVPPPCVCPWAAMIAADAAAAMGLFSGERKGVRVIYWPSPCA